MTTSELYGKFNNEFGFNPWPKTYEVDAETYANVCQSVIEFNSTRENMYWDVVFNGQIMSETKMICIAVGINNGIMFKNVELILKVKLD